MTMTTKELLALVDTLRARATEHGDLHRKQTGYEISFEDAGKESAYDNAADELAPIATALCAEVEALLIAAKSARRALARAAQMDPAFNGAYQELDAAIDAARSRNEHEG